MRGAVMVESLRERIAHTIARGYSGRFIENTAIPSERAYDAADAVLREFVVTPRDAVIAAGLTIPRPPKLFGDEEAPDLQTWLHFVDGITSLVAYRQPGIDEETKRDLIAISTRAREWARVLDDPEAREAEK